jgi:hypothetical protein
MFIFIFDKKGEMVIDIDRQTDSRHRKEEKEKKRGRLAVM